MKWLVDNCVMTDEESSKLKNALETSNDNVIVSRYRPFIDDKIEPVSADEPVVVYGTIQCARKTRQYVGNLYNEEDYLVTHYRESTGIPDSYWLNNGGFYTWGYLLRNYDRILHQEDALFIRPNSGGKVFTGFPVRKEKLLEEANSRMQLTGVEPTTLVQVSKAWTGISAEYRLFVYNQEVITGSQYQDSREKKEVGFVPDEVIAFGNEVARQSNWLRPYVLDVAILDHGHSHAMYVLEINCITCSGWYMSDYDKIVAALNDYTLKAHDDLYKI